VLFKAKIKRFVVVASNLSISSTPSTGSDSMAFTKEEVDAMRVTKHLLLTKFKLTEDKISNIMLAITTMNCQCKPETAAAKYAKLLMLVDDGVGIKNFDDVLNEVGFKGENLVGSCYEVGLASVYYGKMIVQDITYDQLLQTRAN
jgi:hypothetical protein